MKLSLWVSNRFFAQIGLLTLLSADHLVDNQELEWEVSAFKEKVRTDSHWLGPVKGKYTQHQKTRSVYPNMVAIGHTWLLSTGNVASTKLQRAVNVKYALSFEEFNEK